MTEAGFLSRVAACHWGYIVAFLTKHPPRIRRHGRKSGRVRRATERKILVSFRCEESKVARIARMFHEGLATGRYNWKTLSQAYNGILSRGLVSYRDDPVIAEYLPHLEVSRQLEHVSSARHEAEALLAQARTEIAALIAIGAKTEAGQYFYTVVHAAEELPATVWRDWLLRELRAAFPTLLHLKPAGIVLVPPRHQSRSSAR